MVDEVEQLAIDRAKQLFGAEHANVQPHSGAQANFAAFMALIKPGDTLMGMSLPHGGHLTHGAPVNHSGSDLAGGALRRRSRHRAASTTTQVRDQARRERPKLIIAGGSAYARIIDFAAFRSHRRRGRRVLPGGHGALRGAGGRRRVSLAGAARPRRHHAPRTRRCAARAAG